MVKGRRKNDALLATEMDGGGVEESVDLLGTGGYGILLGGLKGVDREKSGINVALILRWIRKRKTTERSRRSVWKGVQYDLYRVIEDSLHRSTWISYRSEHMYITEKGAIPISSTVDESSHTTSL